MCSLAVGRQSPSSTASGAGVSTGEKVPGPGRQPTEHGPAPHLISNGGQQHLQQCEQSSALQQRWLWGTKAESQHLWGGDGECRDKLFTVVPGRRVRINRHKLKLNRFRLEIRNEFFPTGAARQWSRLPRESVPSLSLDVLEPHLDKTLITWSDLADDPAWVGGWASVLPRSLPTWMTLWMVLC